MMGGNFGSAAGAFLLFPVIVGVLAAGALLGGGAVLLWQWVF